MSSVLALPWWRGPRSAHAGLGLQGWLRCGRGGPGPGRAGRLLWSAWYLICSTTPAFVLGAPLSCAVRTGWPHSGRTRPAPAGGPPRGAQVRSRPQAGVLCTDACSRRACRPTQLPETGPPCLGCFSFWRPTTLRSRASRSKNPKWDICSQAGWWKQFEGENRICSLLLPLRISSPRPPCPLWVFHASSPASSAWAGVRITRSTWRAACPRARPRRVGGKRPGEDPGICTVKCVKWFPRAKLHSPPT